VVPLELHLLKGLTEIGEVVDPAAGDRRTAPGARTQYNEIERARLRIPQRGEADPVDFDLAGNRLHLHPEPPRE